MKKKVLGKKQKEALMKEYAIQYAKLDEETEEEWKYASVEANRLLD